jgi:hypothetical protein
MLGSLARADFWNAMLRTPVLARTGALLRPRTRLLHVERFIRRRLRPIDAPTDAASAGHLAAALDAAAQYDVYWSNEHFYRWLGGAAPRPRAAPIRSPLMAMDRRFVVRVAGGLEPATKRAFLRRLALDGRFPGAAVALGRWLARSEGPAPALDLAREALTVTRHVMRPLAGPFAGIHILENQVVALERALAGKPVHRALQRYLGDDDGYLAARTCPFPFERLDIQENGNASVCCAHWTPGFSIGNVMADGATTAMTYNSAQALSMRQSVLDGSFRHCDHVKCPWIAGDMLPRKAEVEGRNARRGVDAGELRPDAPSYVYLAFDASCNLSCPSCRLTVITEKSAIQVRKEELIESSIMPLLRDARRLNLNAAGELFVSRPLRRLLARLNRRDFPDLAIEIITNGTLLNAREWDKFPGIHDMVDSIRISIDAATKPTFELLRRGARWEPFLDNMRFLAGLRAGGVINLLQFSMTYQCENFREMPDFVDLFRSLDPAARIIFEKLENWGTFTPAAYAEKAVHLMSHPLHEEFLAVIRRPMLKPEHPLLVADYAGLL